MRNNITDCGWLFNFAKKEENRRKGKKEKEKKKEKQMK